MKKFIMIILCAICAFGAVNAQEVKKKREKKTVVFHVAELKCKNCEEKIQKSITHEKGMFMLKTMLSRSLVELTYYPDKTTEEELASAFSKLGYTTKVVVLEPATGGSCCGGGATSTESKEQKK